MSPARATRLGLAQPLRTGDTAALDRLLSEARALGLRDLRTEVCWEDWLTPEGVAFHDALFARAAAQGLEVVPCLTGTPARLGLTGRANSPLRRPEEYADFVEAFVLRHGAHLGWVELWGGLGELGRYDTRLDPTLEGLMTLLREGSARARRAGKRVLVGGFRAQDGALLGLLLGRGLAAHLDALGLASHGESLEEAWSGWSAALECARQALVRHGAPRLDVWVSAAGYSTWRHDERRQLEALREAAHLDVPRVYWDALWDAPEAADPRAQARGLAHADGAPKLALRLWREGGLSALEQAARLAEGPRRHAAHPERQVVVFGGAGFVGCNVAHAYLSEGRSVRVFDSLTRPGVEQNLRWLEERFGDRLEVDVADVRDARAVRRAVARASEVFHFAAQVAVTTSLDGPVHDFEVNARGTLNVLEAVRGLGREAPLVFTSTNKVYGGLPGLTFHQEGPRYAPVDPEVRARGIGEGQPLDFESPYGCSKGSADQYVLDYGRTWGLPTCVFRMSCIYGPRQFGTEDQGWVAHFLIRALQKRPITLYGDGMQVRDILFVEDLVRAFRLAQAQMPRVRHQAFNIGGGPERTVSLLELLDLVEELVGVRPEVRHEAWRPGDQRYYVSDTRRFQQATGWAPQVGVREGVGRLHDWLAETWGVRPPRAALPASQPQVGARESHVG